MATVSASAAVAAPAPLTATVRPGEQITVPATIEVPLPASLDVGLLLDMSRNAERLPNQLAYDADGIYDELESGVPDLNLSMATFTDIPESPYGSESRDYPFSLKGTELTRSGFGQAISQLTAAGGGDEANAQIPALAYGADGTGFAWRHGSLPTIAPTSTTFGGFQFRSTGSAHVELLVSLWPFHGGIATAGESPFSPYSSTTLSEVPTEATAVEAMNDNDVRFAGVVMDNGSQAEDPALGFDLLSEETGTALTPAQPHAYGLWESSTSVGGELAAAISTALHRVDWTVAPDLSDCAGEVSGGATPASVRRPSGTAASFSYTVGVPANFDHDGTVSCTISYRVGGIAALTQPVELRVVRDPAPAPTPPSPITPHPLPSNAFTATTKAKGARTVISLSLPGAGRVAVKATTRVAGTKVKGGGKGADKTVIVGAADKALGAGSSAITIQPTAAARSLLKKGPIKAKVVVTFSPDGSTPAMLATKVTLRKTAPPQRPR